MSKRIQKKRESMVRKVRRARLSIDEGFAERPLYKVKAFCTEKEKGILMMNLIRDNFNINDKDQRDAFRKELKRFNEDAMTPTKKDAFTRNERGNIISPFASKIKKD